jgi:hypothetical protein
MLIRKRGEGAIKSYSSDNIDLIHPNLNAYVPLNLMQKQILQS